MRKLFIVILLSSLLLLSGCQVLSHLGGKHSPAMVEEMVKLIEAVADNIEAVIILKCWWLIPGCLIGLGAAAFLAVMKQVKVALGLAAGMGVTLVLSITVFKHFALIGYIVLAIGVLIAGYALWRVWLHCRALVEAVETTEKTKPLLSETSRQMMFGGNFDKGEAHEIQSPATEKIIAKIRGK